MKNLHGETGLPNLFQVRAGNREFALPETEVEGAAFGRGARVVATLITALVAMSFVSAICSIASAL